MQPTLSEPELLDSHSRILAPEDRQEYLQQHEPRNLIALAVYQIVVRIGWIFKTESIVMPAFLDYVVGSSALGGLLRGCLPMLNRFGHSVPPVLFSRRLKVMGRKRWALAACTLGMAAPFLILAGVRFFQGAETNWWMPWLFLALYGIFFAVTGMNQLSMHTLQGKLIQPNRRGRLLALSTGIGCPLAIVAAWLWLGDWLALPGHGFHYVFGFTGLLFLASTACTFALREPADDYEEAPHGVAQHFTSAWALLRTDANFRRLAVVAALFSVVLMLFPHYQAMAREVLKLDLNNLMLWVIVQNAGTGLFSLLAGPMADGRGNRLVLRLSILCCATTPLLAAVLSVAGFEFSQALFPMVFLPIGLTPVAMKTIINYTLEISPVEEHPRYVSTLSLCLAAPIILLSPLVGLIISLTSFGFVFLLGAALILLAALLTFRLSEPRHHIHTDVDEVGVLVED